MTPTFRRFIFPALAALVLVRISPGQEANPQDPAPEAPLRSGIRESLEPDPHGKSRPLATPPDPQLRPIDRWMNILRRSDPEQYLELEHLRNENPEAFRDVLRERLSEIRRIQRMPPGDTGPERRRGLETGRPQHPVRPSFAGSRRDPATEKLAEIERSLAHLAERYRAAPSSDERRDIHTRFRSQLEAWFDLRQEQTEQRILRAEAQLERLRRMLEEGRTYRADILDQRQQHLLEGRSE